MQHIAWVVLRQVEALRESVASTLNGGAIDHGRSKSDEFKATWLREQGVQPTYYNVVDENREVLSILKSIQDAIASHGIDLLRIQFAGTRSRFGIDDLGFERGSTGWDRLPNFVTSSALVRLLGAMEQFEIDVLKALLHYRPAGKNSPIPKKVELADLAVVSEQPDENDRYAMPALWSWIKKPAENAVERRKLLMSVFDIDCYPSTFGTKAAKDIRKYYQNLYEQRNAIAHGRARVDVTLAAYCEAEAFVLALVMHLSAVCEKKYKLAV